MKKRKNSSAATPTKKGTIVALEREEWDFATLPKAEIEACYLYEYGRGFAREHPCILKLLSDFQGKFSGTQQKGWVKLCTELHKQFAIGFPDFPSWAFQFIPGLPWQRLADSDRSHIVGEVRDGYSRREEKSPLRRLNIQTLRELEPANITSLRTFKFYNEIFHEDFNQTEYGFFALNWKYTDKEIRDAFNAWFSEQRAERDSLGIANVKHKSRGGFRDRLNWLGALRIVNHYPAKRLADYTDSNLKIDAPYSHLPDLYENAKKARELLAALFGTDRS